LDSLTSMDFWTSLDSLSSLDSVTYFGFINSQVYASWILWIPQVFGIHGIHPRLRIVYRLCRDLMSSHSRAGMRKEEFEDKISTKPNFFIF
jgi:hypothetical protein